MNLHAHVILAVTVLGLTACTTINTGPALVNAPFSIQGVKVPPETLNRYFESHYGFISSGGEMQCAYTPLGQDDMQLFVWLLCLESDMATAGPAADPAEGSGLSTPAAFTVELDGSTTRVVGVELPELGGRYAESVRRIFPASVQATINADMKEHDARLTVLRQHLAGETR